MFRSINLLLVLAAVVTSQPLLTFLESTDGLSSFLDTIQRVPGLIDTLTSASNITILAPLDDAFGQDLSSSGTSRNILAGTDNDALNDLLRYHVLQGAWSGSDFEGTLQRRKLFPTLHDNGLVTGGQKVAIGTGRDDLIFVDSGSIVPAQIVNMALGGGPEGVIVHTIDRVLELPQPLSQMVRRYTNSPATDAFISATETTNLLTSIETLSDITVFSPVESFDSTESIDFDTVPSEDLEGILQHHIISGSVLTMSDFSAAPDGTVYETIGNGNVSLSTEILDYAGMKLEYRALGGARLTGDDVLIANGIYQSVDGIFEPPQDEKPTQDQQDDDEDQLNGNGINETTAGMDAVDAAAATGGAALMRPEASILLGLLSLVVLGCGVH